MNMLFLLCLLTNFVVIFSYKSPHCFDGRTAIVHLFEWRWNDIEQECKRFLGPKGFCGVQVSPPNEHAIIYDNGRNQPWWQRYQPVSYKLTSRSGDENAFRNMVRTCNQHKVRIYVDAVVNHMAATGSANGKGSAGSTYNVNTLQFPGVPFGPLDFNCCHCGGCSTGSCNIENYGDANQVRNCRLVGLRDLNLGKDYVRNKIAGYFNHLIDIGVAGFRIDASKHMWPDDILAVLGKTKNLNSAYFLPNSRPYIYQEVIDLGGEPIKNEHYLRSGRVTEFKYGMHLGGVVRRWDGQKMKYLKNFGKGWGMLSGGDALVFVDNHDNQRGHGAGGAKILTFYDSKMYKIANAFMLAWPYGQPRIMSSYRWSGGPKSNDWIGPPHNGDYSTKSVHINDDLTCGNGWVCEHRWRQITNMAAFRNIAGNAGVQNWWDNGNNQIAFSRGNKAFIAINNEDGEMKQTLNTGLPGGRYCDVISGNKEHGRCSGKTVNVDHSGKLYVELFGSNADPVLAIHIDSRI